MNAASPGGNVSRNLGVLSISAVIFSCHTAQLIGDRDLSIGVVESGSRNNLRHAENADAKDCGHHRDVEIGIVTDV